MKKVNFKFIKPDIPGLVITDNGEFIVMENGTHTNFFANIISNKLGHPINEDNLDILTEIIMTEFNYLPYMGCKSGSRVYDGGILLINPLETLNDKQLNAIINFYSTISPYYEINIIFSSKEKIDDRIISIGEIYEELLNRNSKKKR